MVSGTGKLERLWLRYNKVMTNKATEQAKGVSPISGTPPPTHSQFGQPGGNPRHNGSWRKEDTPRFKLEQMMKLSDDELKKVADDSQAPLFERKLAQAIKKGDWKVIKEMTEQVYGKPKESVDISNPDGSLNPYNALTVEELKKLAGK